MDRLCSPGGHPTAALLGQRGTLTLACLLLALAGCAPSGSANRASVETVPPTAGSGGGSPETAGTGGSGGGAGSGGDGSSMMGGSSGGGGSAGNGGSAGGVGSTAGSGGMPPTLPPGGTGGSGPPAVGPPPDAAAPDAPEPDAPPPPVDLPPDTPPPPPNLARGLSGHWKFDEGTGNVVLDSSPVQNHGGTINILATDWQMGRRGGALFFTPARRTFVQISHHDTLEPREGISLTIWANAASWNATQRLLDKGEGNPDYALRAQGNRLLFIARLADGTELRLSAPPPPAGRFVHLAATYDGQQAQLYVDGRPVATMAAPGALAVGGANLTLGGRPAGAPDTEFFSGLLDDLVIYGRALSAVEVRMLFMAGAP